jgi:hypothetical protein
MSDAPDSKSNCSNIHYALEHRSLLLSMQLLHTVPGCGT